MILITPDTIFYDDAIPRPELTDEFLRSGLKLVISAIIPGSREAVGEGTIQRVWGTIQGGLVTAEIAVYESIG